MQPQVDRKEAVNYGPSPEVKDKAKQAEEKAEKAAEEARLAHERAVAARRTADEAASKVKRESVEVITREVKDLITELDRIYQQVLDQMVDQATHADSINRELKATLHSTGDQPVIDFHHDRALTPNGAFRNLADILVQRVRSRLDPRNTRKQVRYDDLLVWRDKPIGHAQGKADAFLGQIEQARSHSLWDFYDQLLIRITPESVPTQASNYIYTQLKTAFAVSVPPKIIVPYGHGDLGGVLFMRLSRARKEKAWHLSSRQMRHLEQALLAISTACAMEGNDAGASLVTSAGNELTTLLQNAMRRYEPGTIQYGGNHIQVVMMRDKIEFHLTDSIMHILRTTMETRVKGVEFVLA